MKAPNLNDYRNMDEYDKAVEAYASFVGDDSSKTVQETMLAGTGSKHNPEFMKADAGKNMLSLIDPQFVVLLGKILTFGAKKYAPNNWQLCEDTSRYKDALLRHLYAYLDGEQLDPESGMSHLGHAAFGLMCLNYFDNLKKDQQ